MSDKFTRRRFLTSVGMGATYLALASTVACEPDERTSKVSPLHTPKNRPLPSVSSAPPKRSAWAFRSRPDLRPPAVEVTVRARDTAPGHIFVAPKNGPGEESPAQDGAMIVDEDGQLVWFRPARGEERDIMDFKVQRYKGETVLTWWEGLHTSYGQGEYVIADRSYRELTRVRAGNGYRGDHHEFLISHQDTALFDVYGLALMDLSSVGGPRDAKVLDGIVQEVDIETGEVLLEWHSLEHIGLQESHYQPPKNPQKPYDHLHINSIDVDHDNNLLVSARRTSTVYKIERESGDILWRLGGKKSDFEMGPGTRFAYQHDARRQRDGTLTIFDNGLSELVPSAPDRSRSITVELEEDEMTATLVREYTHPHELVAVSQGSMQVLPNENVFIGWGSQRTFSEFSKNGKLLFNARFPPEVESYRAFRFPWSAHPEERPAVAAERISGGKIRVYASWNGATEVATWEVLAGPRPGQLEPLVSVARDGFETAMLTRSAEPYVAIRARHSSGRVLGVSKPAKLGS
jgi:Arylsulfotransferase (ASST)